jgi:hypothetical protein
MKNYKTVEDDNGKCKVNEQKQHELRQSETNAFLRESDKVLELREELRKTLELGALVQEAKDTFLVENLALRERLDFYQVQNVALRKALETSEAHAGGNRPGSTAGSGDAGGVADAD